MRTFLATSAAILALTSAANAVTRPIDYPLYLQCGASTNELTGQVDVGNVAGTLVGVAANGQWAIGYKMTNGDVHIRNKQYNLGKVNDLQRLQWTGYLRRNPYFQMIGEVQFDVNDPNKYYYYEWGYDNANAQHTLKVFTGATCFRVTDFTSLTPMRAALPPSNQPQYNPPANNWGEDTSHDSVEIYPGANYMAAMVDVQLGSQTVRMMIDTGASLLSIPPSIAARLVQNGEATYGKKIKVGLANGSSVEEWTINIHTLRIGRHTLNNILGSVSADENAMLLLPFTVLSNIGKFSIDTHGHRLSFN
jgi:hypothetical protein